MPPESDFETDHTSEVIPGVVPSSPWAVQDVQALPGFCLFVRFIDGTSGTVEMASFLASTTAGVFQPLADPVRFSEVHVEYGAVTWPGDLDLAPDAMYDDIRATGVCRVG